jgi:hypothetical protein
MLLVLVGLLRIFLGSLLGCGGAAGATLLFIVVIISLHVERS